VNEDDQRTVAVWVFLAVGFVAFAAFLATQGDLSPGVAVVYWVTVGFLTLLGVVSPPWAPFVD